MSDEQLTPDYDKADRELHYLLSFIDDEDRQQNIREAVYQYARCVRQAGEKAGEQRGIERGRKAERAAWKLAALGQESEGQYEQAIREAEQRGRDTERASWQEIRRTYDAGIQGILSAARNRASNMQFAREIEGMAKAIFRAVEKVTKRELAQEIEKQ